MGIYATFFTIEDEREWIADLQAHGISAGVIRDGDPEPEDLDAPYVYQASHVLPEVDHPRGGSVDLALIPAHVRYWRENPNAAVETEPDGPPDPWLRLSVSEKRGHRRRQRAARPEACRTATRRASGMVGMDEMIMYPVTIIATRYGGVYEGGAFAAFLLDPEHVPHDVAGDDITCATWWGYFGHAVGVGATPDAAYDDLMRICREGRPLQRVWDENRCQHFLEPAPMPEHLLG